ncbi:MAG TPA: dipeptide ABC transporter ATP-binding protein [Clostridia bacterium]|nr:dipeptide ABC transporter ATP-binding protein [Clostridia bacterium]
MDTLLEVKDLKTHFTLPTKKIAGPKPVLKAVDDVSFNVLEGEILGVVGESGCGKSTLGRTVLRLENKTAGSVLYEGRDVFELNNTEIQHLRTQMQMVFQDPYSSLNPRKKISSLLSQPLRIHTTLSPAERREKIDSIMEEIGLNPRYTNRFPHQFSGGQRQRIGIARALTLDPEFIICDEAVSALDVSVQAQILNLLLDLQDRHSLTYLFIAHDLGVVEFISSRIMVMYLGKMVEFAEKEELVAHHAHPYTKTLFAAFPTTDPHARETKEKVVMGDVPSPINPPTGCHFHPRCPHAMDICKEEYPELREISPGHFAACHLLK